MTARSRKKSYDIESLRREVAKGVCQPLYFVSGTESLLAEEAVQILVSHAVPAETPLYVRAEIFNMGEATWMPKGSVETGEVAFGAKGAVGLGFRRRIETEVKRGGKLTVEPFKMSNGITEDEKVHFGVVAERRAWASGQLVVHLFVAPSSVGA